METGLKVTKNNLKIWNLKVLKFKQQQETTKNYLAMSSNNLRITNKNLQKMEIFMENAHADPKFVNQIMAQFEKEQELSNSGVCGEGLIQSSLPFMVPNLKLLSRNFNLSFVYKLFDMVNDPNSNSIMLWSKTGTSFFIKDAEGLHDYVQERFNHTIKTFYKTLCDFGFQCVNKFLQEYANENFQRDEQHMLKNIKSKKKLLAVKKNMQSDMEEELKRLRFFQNTLKVNISNMKAKEQTTKCELLHVKRCMESVSKRIAPKTNGKRRVEQDQSKFTISGGVQKLTNRKDGRRPWIDPTEVANADITKIKQDLHKLNTQIPNLEHEHAFIEDQLAAIERILPDTQKKQQDVELSMNNLFKNPNAIPRKRSRKNEKKKSLEDGNNNDHGSNQEDLATNLETQESNNVLQYLMENDIPSDADIKHEDLMLWVGMLEGELTFSC